MQVIQEAIKNKQVLMVCYKGLPRMIEAHIVGANSAGQEFVRGYQVGGTSCTEEVGWKLLDIQKIQAITVIPDQHFAKPRQGYGRSDPVITTVYAQV
ncbi:hypothetical protein ACO0LB_11055 [Undibacterium sp. SXout7W]|uniref:hypothetical protein n=1 Tax=Undibacterium sp. SXout7W TaxID=3413049 RepID=UPI003BF07C07